VAVEVVHFLIGLGFLVALALFVRALWK
jgi:hypothetical protein